MPDLPIHLIVPLLALLIVSKREHHIVLDMFGGGVVLFYPIYNGMAFVDASLAMSQTNQLLWTFDYGFREYGAVWETA